MHTQRVAVCSRRGVRERDADTASWYRGRNRRPGPEEIAIHGSPYTGKTPQARRLFEEAGAEYESVDVTRYADARPRERETDDGVESMLTLAFPDGFTPTDPTAREHRARLGELGYEFAPSNRRGG